MKINSFWGAFFFIISVLVIVFFIFYRFFYDNLRKRIVQDVITDFTTPEYLNSLLQSIGSNY